MSLLKPIIYQVNAFDSKEPHKFEFYVSGGDQVTKNKLIIRNDSLEVVYSNTIESYEFSQTLPPNTLTNGNYYNYYFTTYNSLGQSISSDSISFWCYTNPIIAITNIPSTNKITNSNYVFKASYNQAEDELLDVATFALYDIGGNIISKSDNLYNSNTPPLEFEYEFNGLSDSTNYKISFEVLTIEGTILSTELYNFTVGYYNPQMFSLLDLKNNCDDGLIEIDNNMILIDGNSNPTPPTYDNGNIILTSANSYVEWEKGYFINGNFELKLFLKYNSDGIICVLSNNKNIPNSPNKIEISINVENNLAYFTLDCYDGLELGYSCYSDSIAITTNDLLCVWVRRINGIYELKMEVVE